MSFNRPSYDTCAYNSQLGENVSILSYQLSPFRYEHQDKCRHQLGIVGGSAVSHVKGNMVDLESELRGQTRYISKCSGNMAQPLEGQNQIRNDKTQPIDISKKHLPTCQFIAYRSVPLPPSVNPNKC
jgi:hypothetical protein